MSEVYQGFTLNVAGDAAPWGTIENTLFKALIDDIVVNNTHVAGDGSDHADVATNTADIATNVTAIGLNTTHRGSDGKDHSDVVLNNTHRADNSQAHTDYLINNGNDTTSGTLDMATGSTIGNLTLANGSITDSSGAIAFGNENLSTTGTVQGVTQAEFDDLTDNSMADTLHRHSELSASDGTPDQALTVSAVGYVGIGKAATKRFEVYGSEGTVAQFESIKSNGNANAFVLYARTANTGDNRGIYSLATNAGAGDAFSFYGAAGKIYNNGKLGIGAEPLTNECDIGCLKDGVLALKETTTPTADTNYGKLYTKNDNKLYFQDGAGAEHEVDFV